LITKAEKSKEKIALTRSDVGGGRERATSTSGGGGGRRFRQPYIGGLGRISGWLHAQKVMKDQSLVDSVASVAIVRLSHSQQHSHDIPISPTQSE